MGSFGDLSPLRVVTPFVAKRMALPRKMGEVETVTASWLAAPNKTALWLSHSPRNGRWEPQAVMSGTDT